MRRRGRVENSTQVQKHHNIIITPFMARFMARSCTVLRASRLVTGPRVQSLSIAHGRYFRPGSGRRGRRWDEQRGGPGARRMLYQYVGSQLRDCKCNVTEATFLSVITFSQRQYFSGIISYFVKFVLLGTASTRLMFPSPS